MLLAPLCRMLREDVTDALQDPRSPLVELARDWRQLLSFFLNFAIELGGHMSKLMQTSKVNVVRESAPNKIKRAEFEGFPVSVRMGVHGGIADFFHLKPAEPVVSALDYVVAALGCCMTGTIGGALEARGVSANPENLQAHVEGKIEDVDGKLILTGIKVHYRMKVPKEKRASIERGIRKPRGPLPRIAQHSSGNHRGMGRGN